MIDLVVAVLFTRIHFVATLNKSNLILNCVNIDDHLSKNMRSNPPPLRERKVDFYYMILKLFKFRVMFSFFLSPIFHFLLPAPPFLFFSPAANFPPPPTTIVFHIIFFFSTVWIRVFFSRKAGSGYLEKINRILSRDIKCSNIPRQITKVFALKKCTHNHGNILWD